MAQGVSSKVARLTSVFTLGCFPDSVRGMEKQNKGKNSSIVMVAVDVKGCAFNFGMCMIPVVALSVVALVIKDRSIAFLAGTSIGLLYGLGERIVHAILTKDSSGE